MIDPVVLDLLVGPEILIGFDGHYGRVEDGLRARAGLDLNAKKATQAGWSEQNGGRTSEQENRNTSAAYKGFTIADLVKIENDGSCPSHDDY